MKIQVNTDNNIEGHEELVAQVEATVTKSMSHFSDHGTLRSLRRELKSGVGP